MDSLDSSAPKVDFGPELFKAAIGSLLEYRRGLSSDLGAEEIRRHMRAYAEGLGVNLETAGWEKAGVSPEWLLDVVESLAAGRESEVPDIHKGYFWFEKIAGERFGVDFDLPVMMAIMTPFVPRKEFLARLDYAIQRTLQANMRMRPATLRKAVRCLTLSAQGMTDGEIADLFLSEEKALETELTGRTPGERHREAEKLQKKEEAVVRQLKSRLAKVVTEVTGLVSQE